MAPTSRTVASARSSLVAVGSLARWRARNTVVSASITSRVMRLRSSARSCLMRSSATSSSANVSRSKRQVARAS